MTYVTKYMIGVYFYLFFS